MTGVQTCALPIWHKQQRYNIYAERARADLEAYLQTMRFTRTYQEAEAILPQWPEPLLAAA